jgi:hypothetical protein
MALECQGLYRVLELLFVDVNRASQGIVHQRTFGIPLPKKTIVFYGLDEIRTLAGVAVKLFVKAPRSIKRPRGHPAFGKTQIDALETIDYLEPVTAVFDPL